jgi:hypothetical protein
MVPAAVQPEVMIAQFSSFITLYKMSMMYKLYDV